jgi:murein DD-endopeptidase MepM/ murein hydrolase activator NlpD
MKNLTLYIAIGVFALCGAIVLIYYFRGGKMSYPVNSRITSPYGNRMHPVDGVTALHNGIDLAGKVGDKIKAPAPGTVKSIYHNEAGGNQMTIVHDNGYTTGYAHLSKYLVKTGEKVKKGQPIAEIGNTGKVTGPHLHFTMKDSKGQLIDPETKLA